MNRIELEKNVSIPDLLFQKTSNALSHLKNHPLDFKQTKEVSDLEMMLNFFIKGHLLVDYRRSNVSPTKMVTTVSAVHRNEDSTLPRLNFHSRLISNLNAEKVARELEIGIVSQDVIKTEQRLQVSTIKGFSRDSSLPIQRSGIEFVRNPYRLMAQAHGLIYQRGKVERVELGMEISQDELLAMQGEILRLFKLLRFSPALRARTTS